MALRRTGWVTVLALPLLLSGCGVAVGTVVEAAEEAVFWPFRQLLFLGAFKYDNPWDERWEELPSQHEPGEVLVGVAVSGGGSRSAYFATCVLEELARRKIPGSEATFLQELDFISGVSGGSLASAYYVANWGREGYPSEPAAFFERMKLDMCKDFELRLLARILLYGWPLLQFTFKDTGQLLAAVWDSNFFDDLTFADLDPAGPTLLVNATCYNNGQKFVFTRQRMKAEAPRFNARIGTQRTTQGWGAGYRLAGTMTMETIDSSIGECPLSTAVMASAAVPNLLGVTAFEDRARDRVIYLGDGGIYDNHGTESLLQAMIPAMDGNPELPVVLLVIDAAGFFESSESAGHLATMAGFADRTVSISWLRASSYAEATFKLLQQVTAKDGGPASRVNHEVLSLYDDEALRPEVEERYWVSGLLNDVRGVPTRFSVSEDAMLAIEEAAPRVVEVGLKRLAKQMERRRAAQPEQGGD